MNTEATKRRPRKTRESSLSVPNGNSNGNSSSMEDKKLRRLRRKQNTKVMRKQKRQALIQGIIGGALLVIIILTVLDKIFGEEETPRPKLPKNIKKKIMRPDLDNPSMDDGIGNTFENMKNQLKRIGQYKHSDYMKNMGDHSPAYARLRQEYDEKLPYDESDPLSKQRIQNFVSSLHKRSYKNMMQQEMSYDIYNCPDLPVPEYPAAWNIKDVLDNWAPNDATSREYIYQGLCVFDYEKDYEKALAYRAAEVPFVMRNDPRILRTVERWNQPHYIEKLLGDHTRYRTEYSPNNHFMYWMKPKKRAIKEGIVEKDWKPPTDMIRMPYKEWLGHANVTDDKLGPDHEHWYFRLIGCGGMGRDCDKDSSEYLFDELPFFQPRSDNPIYMVDPKKQKGIHCRFGMKGVIAENHFDGSRNSIVLLGGERRYILSHPDQCENLSLFPRGHPSARHSAVDWTNPDWAKFPKFSLAEVNEVVLQAGDLLYLPTNWFHYIISLELNFQCNTRSGVEEKYMGAISDCGF